MKLKLFLIFFPCYSPEQHLQVISPTTPEIPTSSEVVEASTSSTEKKQVNTSTTSTEKKENKKGKVVKPKKGVDKDSTPANTGKGKKKRLTSPPPKRKYWKAGIYSSTYKEDVIA